MDLFCSEEGRLHSNKWKTYTITNRDPCHVLLFPAYFTVCMTNAWI